jgi:DNA-binding response OmpR family regulator
VLPVPELLLVAANELLPLQDPLIEMPSLLGRDLRQVEVLAEPVRQGELLARIEAVARRVRGAQATPDVVELPPFRLNRGARTVECDGRRVELTDKEYALAEFFFLHAEKVVSRQHLLEAVWGLQAKAQTRTVDTHVSRLRTKLGLGGEHGWRLASVHQFGYRLERAGQ